MNLVKIIQYLTIIELMGKNCISEEKVHHNYRKLVKIYHPDTTNERYKDGAKFRELKEAHDYLIKNIDFVNFVIQKNYQNASYDEFQKYRAEQQEKARKAYYERQEAERRANEIREEKLRREQEARRKAEEERIRAEQEEKKRQEYYKAEAERKAKENRQSQERQNPKVKYCFHCGQKLIEKAMFCHICGTKAYR